MTDKNILEPELAALGAEISAFAPVMDKGFERELGAKVAAGFPRGPKRHRVGGLKLLAPRALVPALGIAAALVVVVLIVGPGTRGGTQDDATLLSGTAANVEPERAVTQTGPAGSLGAAAPQADSTARANDEPIAGPRRVQRAANLELTTSTDDVQSVADGVVRETQAAGGYVADSSVSTSTNDGNARFTLRIPTKNLDKALASLSKLANVGSLSQDSTDITSSYASASDRLADSQAERKALIKALAGASTPGQIASLKQRISINRQEIAAAKSEVRKLQRRADLATVEVQISGKGDRKDAAAGWTPKDAAGDAVAILGAIAGGIIVALAIAIPAAIVGGLAWLAIGAVQRRRRNSALNSA
jgi:hypothetical protein